MPEPDSTFKELWHSSPAIDAICRSDIGYFCAHFFVSPPFSIAHANLSVPLRRFDHRFAYKTTFAGAFKDMIGVGHVYGYGNYFAAEALYPHWWNTRVWNRDKTGGESEHQLILAHVFTGKSKDYGAKWAPRLEVRQCCVCTLSGF